MVTALEKKTTQQAIGEFRRAFNAGMESIMEACRAYVAAIDADPRAADAFAEAFAADIGPADWARFELIGRGQMYPRLLTASRQQQMAVIELPARVQRQVYETGAELLLPSGDTLTVKLSAMTRRQRDQVFAGNHVRTLAEQRAYLEDLKARQPVEIMAEPYVIRDGYLDVVRPVRITREELQRLARVVGK